MKKVKLISMLSIGFVGGGLLTLVPFGTTSCSKESPANVLDPSKSDWTKHFYTETIGAFAPASTSGVEDVIPNGDFVDDWQTWIQGTNYDTLDLGAFDRIADFAFSPDYFGLLDNDMPIRHLIFSGNTCTSIGDAAFNGCTSLISIRLPNSLTSIDIGAFADCSSLTSLSLSNSLTFIGDNAFFNCSSVTLITASYDKTPEWNGSENIFDDVAQSGNVKNTGSISSDTFLAYLKGKGLPRDGWAAI